MPVTATARHQSQLDARVTLDLSGCVAAVNQAAAILLNMSATRAVGRSLSQLLWRSHSEQVDRLSALLSRSPSNEPAHRIEVCVGGDDGRDRWLQLLVTPQDDPPGSTVWLEDITEHKAASIVAQRRVSLMERAEQVAEIGSWEWFPDRSQLEWSDNMYRLYGLEPGSITPTLDYILEQTHPEDRDRVARVAAFLGQEGHIAPVEYRILQPGRPPRRLRSTITAIDSGAGVISSVVGAVEDVTDELEADRKIASHIAASAALGDWESLETSAPRLLRAIAEALEFRAGALWVPENEELSVRAFWIADPRDAHDFVAATHSLRLPRDVGLAGKVWQTGEPINVIDVQTYAECSRRDTAVRAGLRGAVAFPAVNGGEVLAVVELHSRDRARLSRRLMQSLSAIGNQLGQFLAHQQLERHALVLTPRQLEVLGLAAQGCSGREIARALFISPSTVKSHLENIYAALGVSDRASAVAEAMRHDLIH